MFLIFLSVVGILAVILAMFAMKPEFYDTIENTCKKKGFTNDLSARQCYGYTLVILTLAGWATIYYSAFYSLLWFLPEDMGGRDEFGEWRTARSKLSGTMSTFLTLGSLHYSQRAHQMYLQIKSFENKQQENVKEGNY